MSSDPKGKLTGKHGDTLKNRDTEGGRFRDVVINWGTFKSKLRSEGGGGGGGGEKADGSKTGISFSKSQIHPSVYF